MNAKIKAPRGWRWIKPEEKSKSGDRWCDGSKFEDSFPVKSWIGKKCGGGQIIRRIKRGKK